MENETNVWEMLEKSEDKKLFLTKISSAAEKSVLGEIVRLSSIRQTATIIEFKPGSLSLFENPAGYSQAYTLEQDYTVIRTPESKTHINVKDIEIQARVPFTKDTANDIINLLAKALVTEEENILYKIVGEATKAKATLGQFLFGVHTPPVVLPVMDDTMGNIEFIVFEVVSIALPVKFDTAKQEVA